MNLAKGGPLIPSLLVVQCWAVKQPVTPLPHMQAARILLLADLSFYRFCWGRLPLG